MEAVERVLAERLDIPPTVDVRERLMELDRQNQLIEDEVVADWHELYAHYVEWGQDEVDGTEV